jgi:hypothetical protein
MTSIFTTMQAARLFHAAAAAAATTVDEENCVNHAGLGY